MRFGHIGLTCADLERSKSFFSEIFGFEPFFEIRRKTPWLAAQVGYEDADISFCHMRGADGMHLELLQYQWPKARFFAEEGTYIPGNMHLNLWVADAQNVADRVEEWMSARVDFRNEHGYTIGLTRFAPEPLDIEATEVPDGPNKGDKGFYMRDPDGHSIEVIQKARQDSLEPEIAKVIDRLEAARAKQNTNWMDVVRAIYRVAPEEGHRLFKKIEDQDREINAIASESHRT